VKNVTAHYRLLLDACWKTPDLFRASVRPLRFTFTPDPDRGFNRGSTDYFVNGRQIDIGAFDTPKHAGLPVGHVTRVGPDHFDLQDARAPTLVLNNGDALTWWDLQGELQGVPVMCATAAAGLGGGAALAHHAECTDRS
jgi:23S rRNA 5-hydroxycytidine C2501 synthase